jgi:hypothetical protein
MRPSAAVVCVGGQGDPPSGVDVVWPIRAGDAGDAVGVERLDVVIAVEAAEVPFGDDTEPVARGDAVGDLTRGGGAGHLPPRR